MSRCCCPGMSSSSWNSERSGIKPVTVIVPARAAIRGRLAAAVASMAVPAAQGEDDVCDVTYRLLHPIDVADRPG